MFAPTLPVSFILLLFSFFKKIYVFIFVSAHRLSLVW